MADGYLESRQRDYEKRKAEWLRRRKHLPNTATRAIEKPEDEAL